MTTSRKRPGDAAIGVALMRVSTEEQQLGPEAQRRAITVWAEREGVEIRAWHLEAGVSGATPIERRSVLLQALADVQLHGAGWLVVAKRDRLARDVVIAAMIERLAERYGARVSTADGTTDASGPEGALLRSMIDVFAAYERLLISSRTRAALATKKARGERVGEIPYGFQVGEDGKRLMENPSEQAAIAFVQAARAKGKTIRAIVAQCQQRGLCSRVGRPFGVTQVARMLAGDR